MSKTIVILALIIKTLASNPAFAQTAPGGLPASDVNLLEQILESCPGLSPVYSNWTILDVNANIISQSWDRIRYEFPKPVWKAVVAAAEEMKRLDWVVTHHGNPKGKGRVVRRADLDADFRAESCQPIGSRNCEMARSLGMMLFGKPLKFIDAPGPLDGNCLPPQLAHLFQGLISNGYSYDNVTGKWTSNSPRTGGDPLNPGNAAQ